MKHTLWFADNTAPDLPEGQRYYGLDRIYLHGEIENVAGYDLIVSLTGFNVETGVYPVVINANGITYGCTAYIWEIDDLPRGYVILNTDKDSNKFALDRFAQKSERI